MDALPGQRLGVVPLRGGFTEPHEAAVHGDADLTRLIGADKLDGSRDGRRCTSRPVEAIDTEQGNN